MCIINEEAKVTATQLFVAPDAKNERQITVYANNVETNSYNNMMLLPVPYPDTVDFIDLSDYENMFKDLEKSFHRVSRGLSKQSFSMSLEDNSLAVVDVGSYKATLVPSHAQLDFIDINVFGTVNDKIKEMLAKYYGENGENNAPFGYIVCKLKYGSAKYHPFAYAHKIADGKLFVPTRHEHNDTRTDASSSFSTYAPLIYSDFRPKHSTEHEADWDHDIYSFNTDGNSGNRERTADDTYLKMSKVPFDFGSLHSFNKYTIKGIHNNKDMHFGLITA